jgi:hypothetical protein
LGGTLCTSGSSVKTTKVAQIFGLGIFYTEQVMCLIKHGLGDFFGDFFSDFFSDFFGDIFDGFFTNSIGHPART